MTSNTILAIGAHPDDIEFGCGAILIKAAEEGGKIIPVILSLGESGSAGTPQIRQQEAREAAKFWKADLVELLMDGDAKLQDHFENAVRIARIIREVKPDMVLAPTSHRNQHPDHIAASHLAQKAVRLARYGGLMELRELEPHRSCKCAFFDITTGKNEDYGTRVILDVSQSQEDWVRQMQCHYSQVTNKHYIELQVTRSRALGLENNCEYAQCLYLEQSPVFGSIGNLINSNASVF